MTERTLRTIDDRLFPNRQIGDWTISIQADKAGYCCSPKARLAVLEEYAEMEAIIGGPFAQDVDPSTMGLPAALAAKFTDIDTHSPCIGRNLTWDDIAAIEAAIIQASRNPNIGIPPGRFGWTGREVWHGTSQAAAEDIVSHGVRMDASGQGYFGRAFYVADDRTLAQENYANLSADEDGNGAVVSGCIADGANILDLRNFEDYQIYDTLLAPFVDRSDVDIIARKAGIDGLFDRSFGGLAIFNAAVIEGLRLDLSEASPEDESPAP